MEEFSKSLEEIIFDLIDLFSPHIHGINSVLDVGTGPSLAIHIFADIFPQVRYYTADVADYRKRKKLPFAIYNGLHLPFDNSEFDVALLNETLHHCEDPLAVIIEAKRVAGSVYVIEHFPASDSTIKELIETEIYALARYDLDFKTYNPFTEQSLGLLFEKAGLKVSDKIEIPYYGNRKIKKYFFKLK